MNKTTPDIDVRFVQGKNDTVQITIRTPNLLNDCFVKIKEIKRNIKYKKKD